MKKKIAITSDCVCDLPEEMLEECEVEVIHFYITTDHGCFKDMDEITSVNIVEYFENGGQHIFTEAPKPKEYEEFFERILEKYDEVIHIVISPSISKSYQYASEAIVKFQGKVHLFDSGHVSTGIGHFVLKAVQMVKEGKDTKEIINVLSKMKKKVSTSFIVENVDYLYQTRRVSKFVRDICNVFKIHPVLHMKNGAMTLKTVEIGSYEKSVMRYIHRALRNSTNIDKRRAFITHCNCSVKLITKIKWEIKERCNFDELIVTKASATVSSNCGANTIGVIFVRE